MMGSSDTEGLIEMANKYAWDGSKQAQIADALEAEFKAELQFEDAADEDEGAEFDYEAHGKALDAALALALDTQSLEALAAWQALAAEAV